MRRGTRGGIFLYILGAIGLLSVLVYTLTEGPQKSATTVQLDELTQGLYGDLQAVASAATECALSYPKAVDVDGDGDKDAADNPNPLFPLYNVAGTKGGSGGSGLALDFLTNNLVCPGASNTGAANMPDIFGPQNTGNLRVLKDTATYTLNYRTNATEGVLLRVTRSAPSALWEEAAARVEARYSTCKAAYIKDGAVDGGACGNGCLYLWLVRLPATAIVTTEGAVNCAAL